ncbi:MAG TPA: hypothetical protein VF550_14130 [Polyangia bacterium]
MFEGKAAFQSAFWGWGTRIAFALAIFATWTFPAPGLARADQQILVLILRRLPADEILNEAILRIKSELVAGGFQVAVADSEGGERGLDPRAWMMRAGQAQGPSATIGIFGDLQQGTAELWVVDRITSKTVIRRLEVQASSDRPISEVLAIRAQEMLRASLVELLVEENRPAPIPSPPPEIQRRVKPVVEARFAPWTLGLELGVSTFGGWGGIGPTLAPAARLRMALDKHFWVRLTALGLGTRPRVGTDFASASLSQDLLLLEFAACLRPRRLVRPLFSLGLGLERVAVDGTTVGPPFQGERNARWFAVADVGAGVALRLLAHWEVQLEVHALLAAARPAIRFFDVEAAKAGQPTLMAIVTLAGGG